MSDETTAGQGGPVRLEASATDSYSGDKCVLCGREATGIDARIDAPTCRVCASMDLPDGVSETPSEEIATDGGCRHPVSALEDPRMPSYGDALEGKNVGVVFTCSDCHRAVLADARIQSVEDFDPDLATDGGRDVEAFGESIKQLRILRDSEDAENDGITVAAGAMLPSGRIVVEWNRGAFPEGDRNDHETLSVYRTIQDAEQATGGLVVPNGTDIRTDGAGESHAGPPGVEQDERGEWTAFEMAADRLDKGGENA